MLTGRVDPKEHHSSAHTAFFGALTIVNAWCLPSLSPLSFASAIDGGAVKPDGCETGRRRAGHRQPDSPRASESRTLFVGKNDVVVKDLAARFPLLHLGVGVHFA